MASLSIIIVSWNVREFLERCFASIERTVGDLDCEVIVVDNASTDGTADFVSKLQITNYKLQIFRNEKNVGFAKAVNQGIKEAKGEYVLLLNPDTEFSTSLSDVGLHHSVMYMMLRFMESHSQCGILGPKLLNADGTLQPSVRRFPDAWSPTLISFGFTFGPARRYLSLDFDYRKAQRVDQVMGACFLIRRSLIEEIGLLDERFFIWFEEVDFCKRAKNAGWDVWYTPDATVTHHGGQSFAQRLTLQKQWWYSRSMLCYFWKHRQWGAFFLNAVLVPFRLLFSFFLFSSPRRRGRG